MFSKLTNRKLLKQPAKKTNGIRNNNIHDNLSLEQKL